MVQQSVSKQFITRGMLLGLILTVTAFAAGAQNLPIPLPLPNAPTFSTPKDASNSQAITYQMAVDPAGNVTFAWQDNAPADIFFSHSSDAGRTFSAPADLSNDPAGAGSFQIRVDVGGTIYVAWFDSSANAISVIRSTDGGSSFSQPVQISTHPGTPSLSIDPSGNLFLCWVTGDIVPRSILCSQSVDGGQTFSGPVTAATLNRGFSPPLIAVDGAGNINLAWVDDFLIPNSDFAFYHIVFFSSSSDGGATFSPPEALSGHLSIPPTLGMALDPSGNINVLWESIPHGNVFLDRSNDGGATFSITQITAYQNTGISPSPEAARMAIDSSGNIDVAWMDDSLGIYEIFFSRSTDGGASFSAPANLSGASATGSVPQIAADSNGNIDVVWQETSQAGTTNAQSDIFFSRSTNGGSTFSSPQDISNNSGNSSAPSIALDSCGNVNVAWKEGSSSADLFFSRGSVSLGSILNVCLPQL